MRKKGANKVRQTVSQHQEDKDGDGWTYSSMRACIDSARALPTAVIPGQKTLFKIFPRSCLKSGLLVT